MKIRYRINKLQQSVFTDVAYSYANLLEQKKPLYTRKGLTTQDWFGKTKWPPFRCCRTPIWLTWRHVLTLYTVSSSDSKFIWTSFILQIQFFDLDGNLIPYDRHHVSISGYDGEEGDLGNLTNGKTKVRIAELSLVQSRLLWTAPPPLPPPPPKKKLYTTESGF